MKIDEANIMKKTIHIEDAKMGVLGAKFSSANRMDGKRCWMNDFPQHWRLIEPFKFGSNEVRRKWFDIMKKNIF